MPNGTRPPGGSALDTAVTRLQQALALPAYKHEANLRLGYTALRRGKYADALAPLELAAANRSDIFIGYLAQLFRGRAFERLLRWNDAVTAYRAAVAIQPKAQTAELALASALARVGQPVEAAQLADTILARTESVFDPWLAYGQGDFRHWPRIIAALRSAIK
jgi:tetratricopeptide (TPR) repeat protein